MNRFIRKAFRLGLTSKRPSSPSLSSSLDPEIPGSLWDETSSNDSNSIRSSQTSLSQFDRSRASSVSSMTSLMSLESLRDEWNRNDDDAWCRELPSLSTVALPKAILIKPNIDVDIMVCVWENKSCLYFMGELLHDDVMDRFKLQPGNRVLVKTFISDDKFDKNVYEKFVLELAILTRVKKSIRDNVPEIFGFGDAFDEMGVPSLMIVTKLYLQTVSEWLTIDMSHLPTSIRFETAYTMVRDVAEVLNDVHERNILHGSLHLDTIFIDLRLENGRPRYRCVVGGWEYAKPVTQNQRRQLLSVRPGTVRSSSTNDSSDFDGSESTASGGTAGFMADRRSGRSTMIEPVEDLPPLRVYFLSPEDIAERLNPESNDGSQDSLSESAELLLKRDVWALGMLMFHLYYQSTWRPRDGFDVADQIISGDRPPFHARFQTKKDVLEKVIQSCWLESPTHRPTIPIILTCLQHYYNEQNKK